MSSVHPLLGAFKIMEVQAVLHPSHFSGAVVLCIMWVRWLVLAWQHVKWMLINCLPAKDLKYVWLDLFHTVGCHLRQVRCTAYS